LDKLFLVVIRLGITDTSGMCQYNTVVTGLCPLCSRGIMTLHYLPLEISSFTTETKGNVFSLYLDVIVTHFQQIGIG